MALLIFLTGLFLALFSYFAIKKYRFLKRLPPGPYSFIPIFGSLLELRNTDIIQKFREYQDKYGKIFSLSVGDFYVIVVNDYKLISECMKIEELQGRPAFKTWINRANGKQNRGVLLADKSSTWIQMRRFTLRALRDFGLGTRKLEGLIQYELEELTKHIKRSEGPLDVSNLFNLYVFNTLWHITTSKRFESDDPVFNKILKLMTESLKHSHVLGAGFYSPIFIYLFQRESLRRNRNLRYSLQSLLRQEINQHTQTYDEDFTRDFIDAFIKEMKEKENDLGSHFNYQEGKDNLLILLHDLFIAGAETTSTTLNWALMFLALNKNVQEKAKKEIDFLIGRERLPSKDDKQKLIYIEALLNEIHRRASILPFSVFHGVVQDTEFQGHLFPKGASFLPNFYDAHHDVEYWKDPYTFRPERFIDNDGNLIKHKAFFTFSLGKRVCIGESLARDTLFIFLTGLLQKFDIEMDPEFENCKEYTMPKFVTSPNPYKVIFKNRA